MEVYEHAHEGHLEAPHEGGEDAAPKARVQRVIHVEDDDDLRSLCAEVLRDAGFEVLGCPTLAAARLAIRGGVPDVLLLDRDLPDGTGLELARWVRSDPMYASVPIIVFSGRKSPEDVESAIAAGCDAFIGKPCAPSVLVDTVEAMIRPADVAPQRTGRRRKLVPAAEVRPQLKSVRR